MGILHMPLESDTCLNSLVELQETNLSDETFIQKNTDIAYSLTSDSYLSLTLSAIISHNEDVEVLEGRTTDLTNVNKVCQTIEHVVYSDQTFYPNQINQLINLPRARPRTETLLHSCKTDLEYDIEIEDIEGHVYSFNPIDYPAIILSLTFGTNQIKPAYKVTLSYNNAIGIQYASYIAPAFYLKAACDVGGNFKFEYNYTIGEPELILNSSAIFPQTSCVFSYQAVGVQPRNLFEIESTLFSFDGQDVIVFGTNSDMVGSTYELQICSFLFGQLYGTAHISVHIKDFPKAIFNALLNRGPPIFQTPLEGEVTIFAGKEHTLTLPQISDPDNDKYDITVQFGGAAAFSRFQNLTLIFSPLQLHASIIPYNVQIILSDLNADLPLISKYQVNVKVLYEARQQNNGSQSELGNTGTGGSSGDSQNVRRVLSKLKLIEVTYDAKAKIKIIGIQNEQMYQAFTNSTFKIIISSRDFNETVAYTIDSLSSNIMTLSLTFLDPTTLSTSQTFDTLQITTLTSTRVTTFNTIETIPKGLTLEHFIPMQIAPDQIVQQSKLIQTSSIASYALISYNIFLNIFLQGFLSYLFGQLNDISQLLMLSLININIPGQTKVIMKVLMDFVQMDLLQTGMWVNEIVGVTEEDDVAISPAFEQAGYGSQNTVSNLGSTFVFINALASLYGVFQIIGLVAKVIPQTKKLVERWNNLAFWNLPIRFFIQQYQAILTASLINIFQALNNFSISQEEFSFQIDTAGRKLSVYLALALFALSLILPFVFALVICKNRTQLNTKAFTQKYGTLLEGLNLSYSSKLIPYFNVLSLIRWAFSLYVLIYLQPYPLIQIIILAYLTLVFSYLTFTFQPYESQEGFFNINENHFKVFNEVLVFYYLFAMVLLTDFNTYEEVREKAAFAELSIICLSVFSNLIKALLVGFNEIIKKVQNKQAKKYSMENGTNNKLQENQNKSNIEEHKSEPELIEYNESVFVSDVYSEPEKQRNISANKAIMQAKRVIQRAFRNQRKFPETHVVITLQEENTRIEDQNMTIFNHEAAHKEISQPQIFLPNAREESSVFNEDLRRAMELQRNFYEKFKQ
ncbi:hypothetical protein FGO68_gene13774 [Halteria grandinella]|uniref:TRP C-terminal domain-containing protein n=1 Tax=Halteria grandinella TaxID=5974 RepID=A0A8J8P6U0_HALGN|nr:hypothetical protein FGO68_gene13774 [Halteria grandinella]